MLKSDRWIKKMVEEYKMIEPFVENQIKKGIISYGLSSYGYDIRLADEFKIFTNVFNSIVDPKNFDPKSFVDFKGDVCVIPPNSFILGRSVEYLRIPRKVLGICLGKSTYARCGIIVNITPLEPCYDKNTEVLTEKGWKKFTDLQSKDKVATINEYGYLEYQKIIKFQKFKYKGEMIKIKGRNIDLLVTPEHFLYVKSRYRKYFEFIRAKDLYKKYNYELKRNCIWKGEDKRYFKLPSIEIDENKKRGVNLENKILRNLNYQYVESDKLYALSNTNIKNRTFLYHLYKLEKEGFIKRNKIRKVINGHSISFNTWMKIKNDNKSIYLPEIKIKIDDWLKFFGIWLAEGSTYFDKKGNYFVKIAAFGKNKNIVREYLKNLPFHYIETDTGFLILNKQLSLYLRKFGHAPQKFVPKEIKKLPPKKIKIFLDAFMAGDGNIQTETFITSSKKLADDLQELILKCGWASIIRKEKKKENEGRKLNGHLIKNNYDIYIIRISKKQLTPKIYKSSFSKVFYDDYVYDITVPNHTLYVRRNGKPCWSSNCWEGKVTIEISNTTPLPVKVYANEGIAQIIFLESDEECEVSYKDKKGKYDKQDGIVLPLIDK